MEILMPKAWSDALDDLMKEKGIAILLGATDTAKSTFNRSAKLHILPFL